MKKIFIYIILILSVTLNSCQEENTEIQNPSVEEAFTSGSETSIIIKQVTYNDGSDDNIITGGSCVSLELPVTVIVNGEELIINNEEGFDRVEKIIDQYDDDEDSINIIFPVTVILSNHSEIIVTNEEAFEDLIDDCIEDGFDDDIECIDFEYPVELTIYDTQNQFLENLTIENDKDFHLFIENLEDDYLVSIGFPITLILADGSSSQVNNNIELQELIENSEDTCDEDDDMDFDDDDVETAEIDSLLMSGQWVITYFFDETDQTELFNNWWFDFAEDEVLTASNGTDSFNGSWESYGDSGVLELEIDFDSDDPVRLLNREWEVIEYTESKIELRKSGDDDTITVVFEKI
ncbi:hypothetical protein OO013_09520 [Mangrovivirga sp. M17]|uniref:Lipocalin-like domain-containing protein n=1 Tax=Mangrovivirga halotolerans TaxID=2993936 RepID=A0ABT3RQP7_9BACT|nr:hypothetical protein [Mangrovivirga halotolerans]MCX2744104.1 hypothetical protein [Mangrovivirga halotolerans]